MAEQRIRRRILDISSPDRHRMLRADHERDTAGLREALLGFHRDLEPVGPRVVHEAVRRSLGGEQPVSMSCFRDYGIYVSTQTDDDFSYVISYAGEDNLVIGTDYGHGDTSSEVNAISWFKAMEASIRRILTVPPRGDQT